MISAADTSTDSAGPSCAGATSLERSAPNAATLTRLVRVCTYGSLLAIERGRGFENLVLDSVPGALPISGTVPGDPRDNCAAQDEEPGQTSW